MKYKLLGLLLAFFLFIGIGCTKDRNPHFVDDDWDFSGKWNAYGYTDFSGWVPIEVIEIKKTGLHEYSAYKLVGDNGVRSGERTWVGDLNTNPAKIKVTVSNGTTISYMDSELVIKSPNHLAIEKWSKITYVRRTE